MIQKFRKRPVVVEAVQLRWDTWDEICEFVPKEQFGGGFFVNGDNQTLGLRIRTLEGVMEAVEGDWIVKGVKGEVYPVKPDIFEETYEPVDVEVIP